MEGMAGVPPPPGAKPVGLQKPPGYRDPSTPAGSQPPLRLPQRKPLPPSFRNQSAGKFHRRSRCSCRRCFCCFLLVLLIILFIAAIAGTVFYLYFQPKPPSFHLQSLKVSKFNVSVKPDGTFLDAAANATVQVTNHNGKIKYSYKQGDTIFSAVDDDGDVSIGSGTFPEFKQGTKNSTVVKLITAGVKGMMVDDTVGIRLRSRFQSKELKFVVQIRTKLTVCVTGSVTVTFPVKIVCGNLSLKQINNGGTFPRCTINLLRWINLH